MTRRVYTPQKHRTFHNGVFKAATDKDPMEDAEFCKECESITLHIRGLCARCHPKLTMTKMGTSKKNYKGD